MECKWQCENDDYCLRVLAKHWPNVRRYKDVKEVGKLNLEPVDLIAGGFPCQPHSIAGKRRGAEDDRNLWPEFIRIIRETKPRYIIAENVPGIITTYLDTVLSDLEGEGYTCWTFNIPACAFDAPHRRERIFVIAHAERVGRETWPVSLTIRPQVPITERQDAEQLREVVANTEGTGQLREEQLEDDSESKRDRRSADDIDAQGEVRGKDVPDTTEQRLEGQVSTGEHGGEQGLSTECSWWTVEPGVGRVASRIPKRMERLRALGNAVVPQVAEWIGERIMEVENEKSRGFPAPSACS